MTTKKKNSFRIWRVGSRKYVRVIIGYGPHVGGVIGVYAFNKEVLIMEQPSGEAVKNWFKRTNKRLKAWARKKAIRFVDELTHRPVYFYESGMDCDCVKYGYRTMYKNIWEADEGIENSYMSAEGPWYIERITKEKYDKAKPYSRDLAMEAHEDGHDHVVYY